MRRVIMFSGFALCLMVNCFSAFGAEDGLAAWWKFDTGKDGVATDSVGGIDDAISGNFEYVDGVVGKAIDFDGYTTSITREAAKAPRLVESFTIEAWVAPQVYPWNWTAIVSQAGKEVAEEQWTPDTIPEEQLKAGLIGAKFSEPDFRNADSLDVLKRIEGDWSGTLHDWSARWRGYIVGPVTGEVLFEAEADNGLILKIGEKVVIDGLGRGKARSGKFAMVKGKRYPVVLSYFQDGDPSYLRLYWSWGGGKKEIVGGSFLMHTDRDELEAKKEDPEFKVPARERERRLFFGVDAEGHIGLHLMVNDKWYECTSEKKIDLLKWTHVAGTFDKDEGIRIYINGEAAGALSVKGVVTPAVGSDMLIGKSVRKMYPENTERAPSRKILSNMIWDGLIDEVKIYDRSLSGGEIRERFGSAKPKKEQPLSWREMPSGPKDLKPEFGATYCRLRYCDEWEKLWRVGDYPDILVRFDESPVRLVFWRGTSFGGSWVTENGIWMGDQSLEDGSEWGCNEHMSDKQCRYSHVRLLENNEARVVVHWRYAVVDIRYVINHQDPKTGWGDWTDEYYYIYPDAVTTREQVLWTSRDPGDFQWQETIFFNQPGTRPEDNVEIDALTLCNMKGQTKTYSWANGAPRSYSEPAGANIQMTNLKAKNKHFIIMEPGGEEIGTFTGGIRKEWSHFPWWNHWPVAQLANDGRRVTGPDRPSHSSITSGIRSYTNGEGDSYVGVRLYGMTDKAITSLVPLARSWIYPAKLRVVGGGFESEGYDKYQRAYVLRCEDKGNPSTLKIRLAANKKSPVQNLALVIKDWGEGDAQVKVNGKVMERGRVLRIGHRHRLEGSDLIVWLEMSSTKAVKIEVAGVSE